MGHVVRAVGSVAAGSRDWQRDSRYRLDRKEELKPQNHRYFETRQLMDALKLESENAFNQMITKFRKRVHALVLEKWGLPIAKDAILDRKPIAGIRINPDVVIIDLSQLSRRMVTS